MPLRQTFTLLTFFCLPLTSLAQRLLGKVVSVEISNQDIPSALDAISQAANVPFSYKSDILASGKKISISAKNKTVKQLLDQVFEGSFHYSEKGKYIILHAGGERLFTISGYIQDGRTGARLSNVTVYEDQILASTLTNEAGYFKLPIRNKQKLKTISIIAKKEAYSESYVALNAGYDQELILPILPSSEIILEDVVVKSKQENSWVDRMLLSSRQKIQNINIGNFIAKRPIQTSLLPGLGTHGLLGAQVVNKFSLNLLGGYTAGVNGFEMGSLFNINKGSVRYFQVAGIFNMVSGHVQGFQIGGIYNYVEGNMGGFQVGGINNINLANVKGVQVAGINNKVRGDMSGIQLAGIANMNDKEAKGIEMAGILNRNKKSAKGVQLSGLTNWASAPAKGLFIAGLNNHGNSTVKGMQLAGLFNYARKMKGFQFSVINIADTMEGFGLGLINYYRNGYHKLVLTVDETQSMNIGYLSGTKSMYCLLLLGANPGPDKSYSVSYGVGKQLNCSRRLAVNTELLGQVFYIGHWDYVPLSLRLQASMTYNVARGMSVFGGPAFTITETKATYAAPGYRHWLEDTRHTSLGSRVSGWAGWQIGVRFF